jgi:ribonucleotide monophosphatase NagD (HAD superfamily)
MVGDRLDTDIMFGHNGGMKTLLVFTGVTDRETLSESAVKPDFTIASVGDLLP